LITNLSLNVSAHFLLLRDFRANALILDRLLAHCAANFSAFFLGDWSADFFWNLLGYSATHLLARSLALLLGDLLALLPLDFLAVLLLVRHLLVEALSLGDGSALGGKDLLWQLHLLLPRHQLALLFSGGPTNILLNLLLHFLGDLTTFLHLVGSTDLLHRKGLHSLTNGTRGLLAHLSSHQSLDLFWHQGASFFGLLGACSLCNLETRL